MLYRKLTQKLTIILKIKTTSIKHITIYCLKLVNEVFYFKQKNFEKKGVELSEGTECIGLEYHNIYDMEVEVHL